MPKEVEELVFVWASRLSPYPWVRFDYPFPFVIRSKNRENYSVCSSRCYRITIHRPAVSTFHDPGFFFAAPSSLPFRPFSPPSLPDPFLYLVSRSTCCQVQAAVPYTPHLRVKFAPCG
ncbi:protein Asterix [Trichonephila clavipes]|nr:protein Asterix [Trichonephila clavipes]